MLGAVLQLSACSVVISSANW